jgi:4,5-dihydroxyphthalate decarboxylase
VWTRGILIDDYGLDDSKVTWVVDDEEHVTQLRLPSNVEHAPAGKSLVGMMASGEIEAGFDGNAGLGRSGAPTSGWEKSQQAEAPHYPDLFPNAEELEADWFRRTRIYPVHGTIVVKDAVLKEHPWVARSLFDAFTRAKAEWLFRLKSGAAVTESDRKYRDLMKIVGDDPLPFGMEPNMPTILALEDTAFKQKLIPERIPLERAWVDPEAVS